MKPYFIGHGSPLNAIADNAYARFLRELGRRIEGHEGPIEAVVVFSAHWQTRGTKITGHAAPPQIYDFYGFPDGLYRLKYAPPGSPAAAAAIAAGLPEIAVDPDRGIDHAAWAVMRHLFPNADVPLLEMSLNVDFTFEEHFALGKKIAGLGLRNVLFVGSGNLVHNLYDVDFRDGAPAFAWAERANRWIRERLEANESGALVDAERAMPDFSRAAPTTEHFIPALYILGMTAGTLTVEYDEIQNGSVSMLAFSGE